MLKFYFFGDVNTVRWTLNLGYEVTQDNVVYQSVLSSRKEEYLTGHIVRSQELPTSIQYGNSSTMDYTLGSNVTITT